jgi:predicted dehydrogenase
MSATTAGTGPVAVGIIGAGVISDQYLTNLTTFPDVVVRFVADLDLARAKAQADKYAVPGSGTVEELLAIDEIEIVVNLTIPTAHVGVAQRVLAAGKHVFSEKPFSLDRPSGEQLLAEAHRLGLRVATAPDTFLGAGLQTGKRLIAEGRIGTPLTAVTMFQGPGPESWHPNADFYYLPGGGPLFDMGPYYVTALVQNLGPVRRVAANQSTGRLERVLGSGPRKGTTFPVKTPTHFAALLEFESGASAQSVYSFQSSIHRHGFVEFTGLEGAVVFPDPNNFDGDLQLFTDASDLPEVVPAVGVTSGRGTGVLELARAIRAGVPERASGEQAYHVVDVMVSIAEAAETGEWVAVRSSMPETLALPIDFDPRAATL